MTATIRVALADGDGEIREVLGRMLSALGCQVASIAKTGRELVEQCLALRPDLIVSEVSLPELDGFAAASLIAQQSPAPIVLLTSRSDARQIDRAIQTAAMALLVKPVTEELLGPAIALATSRYGRIQAVEREAADLRQALADRKIIERAKGILMRHFALDEANAFRRLQSLSSTKHLKLVDMAQAILQAVEVFDG